MKEKQLFPCDTTHLARMMLREDDGDQSYVIQSDYNKGTKTYESELIIPVGSPTAELEAWNAYLGAQDTAVNKILRERPELKAYFAELARRIEFSDSAASIESNLQEELLGYTNYKSKFYGFWR
nr:MAG TPA: hypothetical protein [Myoviridae sp. ctLGX4]